MVSIIRGDFKHIVLNINIKKYMGINAWDLMYNYLDKYHKGMYEAYRWLPGGDDLRIYKNGQDITGLFWEEVDRRQKKVKEKNKELKEIIRIAKETNKPILLYKYTEDCNDGNLDCNIDTIEIYIDGNGKYIEKRHHNF